MRLLAEALVYGDKVRQGMGPEVVKRRWVFIEERMERRPWSSGETLMHSELLRGLGDRKKATKDLLFLLVSLRRMFGQKKPEGVRALFPEWVVKEAARLREKEKETVAGVWRNLEKKLGRLSRWKTSKTSPTK